jgi:hypothetical protein
MPPRGTLGILVVAPSDGCPVTVRRLASTQALQSRHVSSASKLLGAPGSHLRPPSLRYWFCGSTRRFFGEPPQTPRADSDREPLPCTGSCPQLHLAFLATMRPALYPAGHRVPRAEPTCLSTPRRPRKARTFRARSSLAPKKIKPQAAPAILGQESVHTTLSITHHSRE